MNNDNKFYSQLSMSKDCSNALSDGMLCECVPIFSNVGEMPDIVSVHGYILSYNNCNELSQSVNSASNNFELRFENKAMQRVVRDFGSADVEVELISSIKILTSN